MHSRRTGVCFSLSRSLVHARVMKLFLHRAPVSCTRTHVHAYVRFYCSRHTARGIRASKAWRSEKCWKLDIQSVRGTAIPVEILLSSRVAPLCIRSRVARLDKSTDKTIIRNRSYVLPIPTRIILRHDERALRNAEGGQRFINRAVLA